MSPPRGIFPNPVPDRVPGEWMVTSYRIAEAVLLADWPSFELEPGRPGMRFNPPAEASGLTPRDILRQRRAEVHRAHFSLARIESHARGLCRREAQAVIARLRENGEGDFQQAALEYAWAVAASLIGIDDLTASEVRARLSQFRLVPGRVWPDPETAGPIRQGLMDLLEPSLLRRRTHPQDDLFSTIAATRRDLSELRGEAFGWLMVAAVNTATAIAQVALLLQAAPGYRSTERELLSGVFDETLRLMPVVSCLTRRSTRRQALGGVTVEDGDIVIIDVWEANRDPEVFGDSAEAFLPGRSPARGAPRWGLGFGAGPRTCLGEHLAREEAVVLLQQAYRYGMELAGPWGPGPGPLPLFSPAPVRFA